MASNKERYFADDRPIDYEKYLQASDGLDEAAERAGGYVADPSTLKRDRQKELEFSTIRRYALQHNIPMSKLTAEDYRKMGIEWETPTR